MDDELQQAISQSLKEQQSKDSWSSELKIAIEASLAPEEIPETLDIRRYVPKNRSATYKSINSNFILTRYRAITDGSCFLYSIFTLFYLSNMTRLERFTDSFLKFYDINMFRNLIANIIENHVFLFTKFIKLLVPHQDYVYIEKMLDTNVIDLKSRGVHLSPNICLLFSFMYDINIIPIRLSYLNGDKKLFTIDEIEFNIRPDTGIGNVEILQSVTTFMDLYSRRVDKVDRPYCFVHYLNNHYEPVSINNKFVFNKQELVSNGKYIFILHTPNVYNQYAVFDSKSRIDIFEELFSNIK